MSAGSPSPRFASWPFHSKSYSLYFTCPTINCPSLSRGCFSSLLEEVPYADYILLRCPECKCELVQCENCFCLIDASAEVTVLVDNTVCPTNQKAQPPVGSWNAIVCRSCGFFNILGKLREYLDRNLDPIKPLSPSTVRSIQSFICDEGGAFPCSDTLEREEPSSSEKLIVPSTPLKRTYIEKKSAKKRKLLDGSSSYVFSKESPVQLSKPPTISSQCKCETRNISSWLECTENHRGFSECHLKERTLLIVQLTATDARFILVKHQQSLLSATKEFLGKKSDIIRLRKELGCAAEVYSASQSCTELNNSPVISSTMDSVVPGNVLRCILQKFMCKPFMPLLCEISAELKTRYSMLMSLCSVTDMDVNPTLCWWETISVGGKDLPSGESVKHTNACEEQIASCRSMANLLRMLYGTVSSCILPAA